MNDGNWGAWRDMVLREIGRQNTHLERLELANTDMLVELGKLRLIAAMCGAGAALLVTIIVQTVI